MPELPEVETTRRGIAPHLEGQRIQKLLVRESRLRWPVPPQLAQKLRGARITRVARRAKYLLLTTNAGTLLIHLGMSGSLRIVTDDTPPRRHDHLDLVLENGTHLRFSDPRRFGSWSWTESRPEQHPLLRDIGPEPLSKAFNGAYLYTQSRGRTLAVKSFLMDSHVVAGVGNIYANEALFLAGIHPARAAGRISARRYTVLADAVQQVLKQAIRKGGTTLRNFVNSEGKPGYFRHSLQVYGQRGAACPNCATPIRETRTGQRSSFYCPHCQH